MSKAPIIEHDMWLFSPRAPGGQLFAAGARHPGDEWADHPSEPVASDEAGPNTSDEVEKLTSALAAQRASFDAAWGELSQERDETQAALTRVQADLAAANDTIKELREASAKASK